MAEGRSSSVLLPSRVTGSLQLYVVGTCCDCLLVENNFHTEGLI